MDNLSARRLKVRVPHIISMKEKGEKIAVLTAYDYLMAKLLDSAGIDIILVGDSLGQVYSGYDTTLPVTMDQMIYHLKCVTNAKPRALVVGDMPFLSFQISPSEAVRNAGRMISEGGAEAVKVEGGRRILPSIEAIIKADIPVMGHLGLTPQSIHFFGGYKKRGKTEEEASKLIDDAMLLEDAGCFSIVLESIPSEVAKKITESIKIPTIGIGAGPYCDGQVLVITDILGMDEDFRPGFVKVYLDGSKLIKSAVKKYIDEVKSNKFPSNKE